MNNNTGKCFMSCPNRWSLLGVEQDVDKFFELPKCFLHNNSSGRLNLVKPLIFQFEYWWIGKGSLHSMGSRHHWPRNCGEELSEGHVPPRTLWPRRNHLKRWLSCIEGLPPPLICEENAWVKHLMRQKLIGQTDIAEFAIAIQNTLENNLGPVLTFYVWLPVVMR